MRHAIAIAASILVPSLALAGGIFGHSGLQLDAPSGGSSSVSGEVTDNLCLGDDEELYFGNTCAAPDYWWVYDATGTELELRSTNCDGGGTDCAALTLDDGTDDFTLTGTLALGADPADNGALRTINGGDGGWCWENSPTGTDHCLRSSSGDLQMGPYGGASVLTISTAGVMTLASGATINSGGNAGGDFVVRSDSSDSMLSIDADLFSPDGAVAFGRPPSTGAFTLVDPPDMLLSAATSFARLRIENSSALIVPTGTTPIAASLWVDEGNWTATGTITTATTVYVEAEPTEGTNNHAVLIGSGGSLAVVEGQGASTAPLICAGASDGSSCNTGLDFSIANTTRISAGGATAISLPSSGNAVINIPGSSTDAIDIRDGSPDIEVVVNNSSADINFRVESNDNTAALVVDAGANTLSIGVPVSMALTQADLTSTCTANELKLDTGGATPELCFCQATNTWYCINIDDTTGPSN
jgi:hypothetical protein